MSAQLPWLAIHAPEGFVLEMPLWPARSASQEDRAEGHLSLVTYNAKEGPFTCMATVRSGPAVAGRTPRELVEGWKGEYFAAMQAAGFECFLADERTLFGPHQGWDLAFARPDPATLTRARLIRDTGRLIALVAIGPRERVQIDGERYLQSFRLAR